MDPATAGAVGSIIKGVGSIVKGIGRRRDRKAIKRFLAKLIAARAENIKMQRKLTRETWRDADLGLYRQSEANVRGLQGALRPSLQGGTLHANTMRQIYQQTGIQLKEFARAKAADMREAYTDTPYDGIDPKYYGGRAQEYGAYADGVGNIASGTMKLFGAGG